MAVQCEHPAATGPDVANAKGWRTINQRMIGIGVFVQLLLIGAIKDGDVRHGINEQTFGPDIFFAAVEASQQAFIGALPVMCCPMSGRQLGQTNALRSQPTCVLKKF